MEDKIIGRQIKKARFESQLTQTQFAKKLGITWEMVSRYENGKSSARKNIEKIAKILNKPIQFFFGVEDRPVRGEILKLTKLLEKETEIVDHPPQVPFVKDLLDTNLKGAVAETDYFYHAPTWLTKKFQKAFALQLKRVLSDDIEVNEDDIGYFSYNVPVRKQDLVLIVEKKRMIITYHEFIKSKEKLPVLLCVEKRYYYKGKEWS